jgi:hypothetical protein
LSRLAARTSAPRLNSIVIWCVILWGVCANASFSLAATEGADDVVWTVLIPDAFPRDVYTWHVRSDGTYREDGRDMLSGNAIQATLAGRWSTGGARMLLRQDSTPFVFDGVVVGEIYIGTLYFNGRAISRFCASRGQQAPDSCNTAPKVAMTSGACHLALSLALFSRRDEIS